MENIGWASLGGPITMLETVRFFQDEYNKSRLVAFAAGNIWMEDDQGMPQVACSGGLSSYNQVMAVDALQKLYIINTGRTAASSWPTPANENYDRSYYLQNQTFNKFIRPLDFSDSASRSASRTVQARVGFDGVPLVFDPKLKTLSNLTATAGTIPTNCTIGVLYRGRLVLAGQKDNPQEWYMSRAFVFTDFDYSSDRGDVLRATSSQNSDAATISGPITAIAPHGDSCIVFATKTSLWVLQGDPTTGQVRNLSYNCGIVDKLAWCHTPDGWLVFLSQDGIYKVENQCSAAEPERMSRIPLPEELLNIDTDVYSVSMSFDVRRAMVHVFVTPNFPGTDSSQHWMIDWNSKGFWKIEFADPIHDPIVVCHRRDLADTNSAMMLACRDGVVRRFSYDSETDDGLPFESYATFPPLSGEGDEELWIRSICAKVAKDSGPITYSISPGYSTEDSYSRTALASGTWDYSLLNQTLTPIERLYLRANDFTVRLAGTPGSKWAIEQVVIGADKVACAGGCR